MATTRMKVSTSSKVFHRVAAADDMLSHDVGTSDSNVSNLGGSGDFELEADTNVTLAPLSLAAAAIEYPILPEDLLVINLTGSIGSVVPPALINIFFPDKSPLEPRVIVIISTKFLGDVIRPFPINPEASLPYSGPDINTPRDINVAILF